ncbi:sugar ABC transporter ATP-binding protein [[Mycoplasma] mobile]|uniref:Xylose ABC transporter ATB-binding protein n=1 Tax=Mycoplasma mobile (strain ATCC 43663 / 163K / NCTC 11711) TaxID=267748 RepID=Q6KIS5_MYCM1|nr:sugar ABC transporter ATP-binding protein [[Mycoplasma] mobile]AAT27500.1 xylose ABC transporter ATB-binding protein [Mycoplasma mobile 163K]
MNKNDYIFQFENVTKKYPGVIALNDVSFNLKKAKITSIVGENGAGKSTLLKVISGVIPFNKIEGRIIYEGKEKHYKSINDSISDGIAIIHQELSISPYLPVYENIFIGNFKTKFGILNQNQMIVEAKKLLEKVGLPKIDPRTLAINLSVAQQQLVEIAKALSKEVKLLILDEPTSSLNDKDSFELLNIMKNLKEKSGITSVFVSHKLNEVEYVADEIIVIRDGKFISQYNKETTKISEDQLIKDIVGRQLSSKFPEKNLQRKIGEIALEVKNFTVEHPKLDGYNVVQDASFNVKKGEIIGISGLVGSGRSELALSIFGKQYGKVLSGEIFINGKKMNINSPKKAITNKLMYATEDRKGTGLIQIFDINFNINLAAMNLNSKFGFLNLNKEIKNSNELKKEIKIKVPNIDYKVETLSGGNQQKVVIAKAITTKFEILIIDEPTKGIDVGSKFEIYSLLQEFALQGKAIVIISSEIEELLGTTDRIYVMSQGKIKGQIKTSDATQEKIIQLGIGKEKNETKYV